MIFETVTPTFLAKALQEAFKTQKDLYTSFNKLLNIVTDPKEGKLSPSEKIAQVWTEDGLLTTEGAVRILVATGYFKIK